MLLSKTAKVKVWTQTFQHYKERGYKFEHKGDIVEVKVEDLTPSANTMVTVKCDICGKVFERNWANRERSEIPDFDTCCQKCMKEYQRRLCLIRHGVEYPAQRQEVKDKRKNTNLERYGVESTTQLPEVQEKMRNTMMERHGVTHQMHMEETKEKIRNTNREKYGYDNPLQSPEVQERIKETNLERYGFENPTKNSDVIAKGLRTKFERGNQESSEMQRFICRCVDGVLNYPLYNMSLDVALIEEKIDIEYNGRGHDMMVRLGGVSQEDFYKRENRRRHQVVDSGWKLIEICAPKDQNIAKEWLINFVNECREKFDVTDINYITININTDEVQYFTL